MSPLKALDVDQLYRKADPDLLPFDTTEEVEVLDEFVGQPRAVVATRFGVGIKQLGYNIYALGAPGLGKRFLIRNIFEEQAEDEPVPLDWCYVNNFNDTSKPEALELPPGKGKELRDDMEKLIEELVTALSTAFENEEYQARRRTILQEFQERQGEIFEELQQRAKEQGVALLRTPSGMAFAPMKEGEVMSPDDIETLSEEDREEIKQRMEALQEELQGQLLKAPAMQRDAQERLRELNREVAEIAVGGLLDELREKYADYPEVVEFLNGVQEDVVENAHNFLQQEEDGEESRPGQMAQKRSAMLRRYKVNLLVDHSGMEGAPVIYENNPTYQNLIGRVEHVAQMGTLLTDFNLIRPGALHKANGGYLIVEARKLLMQPYAWEGLKRALESGKLTIESLGQRLSVISTVSLEPEPIPLNVKVALVGDRRLYYLLWHLDPDFPELFKVMADFSREMDRTAEDQLLYAQLIATLIKNEELNPFDREAVARVIERSSRMVDDTQKLSMRMRSVTDLLAESNYWAEEAGREVVTAEDVQRAIDAQIYRADQMRERTQEAILREIFIIPTTGEAVGQINGLSVLQLGDFAFGRPTRITASIRLGKGNVVDIEREVELGGPIHSKGILILTGFLGSRYASDRPLSLSASLVFEQSYGGVEGDSASSAELYALLSSIAEVPIKQSLAVTGSVDQQGNVQPIGGANEKIEGFFDICTARGLTGEQGVLIPAANVQHLMLRADVREAVAEGKFHIYPVEHVDQGIELLTGMPAGERDEEGNYPPESFNHRVNERLGELVEKRKVLSETKKESET